MIKQIKPIYSEVKTSLKNNEYLSVVAVLVDAAGEDEKVRVSFNLPLTQKNIEALANQYTLSFEQDEVRSEGWNKSNTLFYVSPEKVFSDEYSTFK